MTRQPWGRLKVLDFLIEVGRTQNWKLSGFYGQSLLPTSDTWLTSIFVHCLIYLKAHGTQPRSSWKANRLFHTSERTKAFMSVEWIMLHVRAVGRKTRRETFLLLLLPPPPEFTWLHFLNKNLLSTLRMECSFWYGGASMVLYFFLMASFVNQDVT